MTPVTEGPPLLLRSRVWRQRRCFQWRLGLETWSFTPEFLLTPGCERGHELRTRGKDGGSQFCESHLSGVGGPVSLSSFWETAPFWTSWPHCCGHEEGEGSAQKACMASTPPPIRLHFTVTYDTCLPFQAAIWEWDPLSFTWLIFTAQWRAGRWGAFREHQGYSKQSWPILFASVKKIRSEMWTSPTHKSYVVTSDLVSRLAPRTIIVKNTAEL